MKLSQYFLPTLKEKPKDVVIKSHEYMLRGSMIQMVGAGFYSYLPLGYRVLQRVQKVIEEEMNAIGALQTIFPSIIPKHYFEQSGRWEVFRDELFRLKDANDMDISLAPTHEELFTDMVLRSISSYKQLPLTLYQVSEKFRNEIRARFGLMRAREFRMKDAYSFDMDSAGVDKSYDDMKTAYCKILERLGLRYASVKADSGAMGGDGSEEFMVFSDIGEDEIISCGKCGYSANVEKAVDKVEMFKHNTEETADIHTPNMKSIEDITSFLKVEKHQCAKSMVYKVLDIDNQLKTFVVVVLRGDYEVNEVKLTNYFGEGDMVVAATPEEIEGKLKWVMGYIGPVIVGSDVKLIVDTSIDAKSGYYVVGGNKKDTHTKGFNLSRDLKWDFIQHDVHEVHADCICVECGNKLESFKGIEVGHIFKLGDKYTKAFDWKVVAEDGQMKHPLMGCYGIGVDRLIAAIIEQHHDENGIRWTKEASPFDVIVMALNMKDDAVSGASQTIYSDLQKVGLEVLLDDTDNRAGYKFNNADLIGIPLQVIVGSKKLEEGKVELKNRQTGESKDVLLTDVVKVLELERQKLL